MPAFEPFCTFFGIPPEKMTTLEFVLLEAELYIRICDELKEFIREQHKEYFNLINYSIKKENKKLDRMFIRFIIYDIIHTGDYNIGGLAYYIGVPEDVIYEILSGHNYNPSFLFSRNLICLHRTVRPDIYRVVLKKTYEELKRLNLAA